MSCDVGRATEGLENELWRRWRDGKLGEWAELIDGEECMCFSNKMALRRILRGFKCHMSMKLSNKNVQFPLVYGLPDRQIWWAELILQAFRLFTYVTPHSPILLSLYLRHSSFSYSSVASPTSQLILQPFFRFSYVTGFHLRHLASRPWKFDVIVIKNENAPFTYYLSTTFYHH